MRVVLLSTYELGRQPFGLASPAAWLRRAGADVTALDLSLQRLDIGAVRAADIVGFYLPMHTATRLAMPVIDAVRALNPAARLCAFGLYAPLNADWLGEHGVAATCGAEFEPDLVRFAGLAIPPDARGSAAGTVSAGPSRLAVAKLEFIVPDRTGLPAPARYAELHDGGVRRAAGYTEASRGCRHRCRHCPIVPVYDGQVRLVPADIVIADVRQQVAAGATHISFGDPDFFNAPSHADRVVTALHDEFPALTYDVTIKVEHLLRHEKWLPRLAETGCLFVTTAAESVDDRTLAILDKGHTAADFERAVRLAGDHGLTLAPTFLPFTPWSTTETYVRLLDTIRRLDLVPNVAPIQLAIRLLIPRGSKLLGLPDVDAVVGAFDPGALAYPWTHPDADVDALQREVMDIVGRRQAASREDVFERVCEAAAGMAGHGGRGGGMSAAADAGGAGSAPGSRAGGTAPRPRTAVPFLNEPWYC